MFESYIKTLSKVMMDTEVTLYGGEILDNESAVDRFVEMAGSLKKNGNALFFVGNGASAMMSSHMATDFCKNGGIRSMSFNEPSLMTAIGNDICYEECFSFPLERFGQKDDMLVSISSSGNSPNVVAALEKAREMGLVSVTLSGMKPDNKSRQMGDLNFYVPGETYGLAESAHQVLLHCLFDEYLERYCPE